MDHQTALIACGAFSILIVSPAGATASGVRAQQMVTAYVLLLAMIGPLVTRWSGDLFPRGGDIGRAPAAEP